MDFAPAQVHTRSYRAAVVLEPILTSWAWLDALQPVAGTPNGPYDMMIAGQLLARGLTWLSRNADEFGRVAGLRLERF